MACPICGCPQQRWLRVATVAEQFGRDPKSVRRLIKKGLIEGVRFGRQWRIDHESLDEFVRTYSVRFSGPDAEPVP